MYDVDTEAEVLNDLAGGSKENFMNTRLTKFKQRTIAEVTAEPISSD